LSNFEGSTTGFPDDVRELKNRVFGLVGRMGIHGLGGVLLAERNEKMKRIRDSVSGFFESFVFFG
jgi:hypothetical protein